jgi:N-acetylneuraminic acid mutarotase
MKFTPALIMLTLSVSLATAVSAQEDQWDPVAAMPTARESVAACSIDGQIYAVGGFVGGSDPGLNTNERYDPASDSWTAMAPMPTGRRMPVAVAVNGICYVIGGRPSDGPMAMDVVEEFDPSTNSWRTRTPMPTARFGHTAAVVDGIIYVVGGAANRAVLNTLEAYDPATDQWQSLTPVPLPRALMAAAAHGGRVYVMGGTQSGGNDRFGRLDVYDPETDEWTSAPAMPTRRYSLQAAVANGRIYAVGGADGPSAVADVEAYEIGTGQWTVVTPLSTRRARFALATVDNRIYAIGGTVSFDVPHVGMNLVERYTPAAPTPAFTINSGISDAWYNPATDGQGLLITVFPESRFMFVAWFTYDVERPSADTPFMLGEPGHRWVTAQGFYDGNTADLTIYQTGGGVFDAIEPAAETDGAGDGRMTIQFADCGSALVSYEITSVNLSGEIPIQRVVPFNEPWCESLSPP